MQICELILLTHAETTEDNGLINFSSKRHRILLLLPFRDCVYSLRNVRRWTSILMLAIIGAFSAVPLVRAASADLGSALPACCRRDGKHHCAMNDEYLRARSSDGPTVVAPLQHCPMYPQWMGIAFLRSPFRFAALPTANIFSAGLRNHPACFAQTFASYRISAERSRLERGPPSQQLA